MRLKIKISATNESFAVELDDKKTCYGDLLEKVATELEKLCPQRLLRFQFKLSLNGKTPIEALNDGVSVASLGIVTGDVLHLLAGQQIISTINEENKSKKVAREYGYCNVNQEENIEIDGVSNTPNPSESKLKTKNIVHGYYNQVHLIREIEKDRFPKSLIDELHNFPVSNDFQALLVVVRVLMKEEGFTFQNTVDESDGPVIMECAYKDSKTCCKLVVNLLGDKVFVNGFYSTFFGFSTILIPSFTRKRPLQSFSVLNYQQLPALSKQFKDDIVYPLIVEIKYDLGIYNQLQLDNLPEICLMKILKMLGHKDLCRISSTCSALNKIGNCNALWNRLFIMNKDRMKDATQNFVDHSEVYWKSEFQARYMNLEFSKVVKRYRYPNSSFYPNTSHSFGRLWPVHTNRPVLFPGNANQAYRWYHADDDDFI